MGRTDANPGLHNPGRVGQWLVMKARRLFAGVAVAATDELRATLAELQRALRLEKIRWTRPEKLHLTVEFFGFVDPARIPELEGALARAAAGAPPFALQLGEPGLFGNLRHPRVLWLGVESAGLVELHARTAAALRAAGWTPEARPYAPHLTLGRLDRLREPDQFRARLEAAGGRPVPIQEVRELILYESLNGQYLPLARWPLAGA